MSNRTVTDSARGWVVRQLQQGLSDVVCVVAFLALADLVLLGFDIDIVVVRAVFGAPLLAVLPGYVLVTALFPRSEPPAADPGVGLLSVPAQYCGPSAGERLALSFGASVALLPLLALGIAAAGWPYTPGVVVGALSAFVAVGALVGAVRRLRLPASARYRVSVFEWYARVRSFCSRPNDPRRVALNVGLAVGVVGALTVAGLAFAAPPDGESYAEFQLLTENESGDLTASNYPAEFTAGEERAVTTAVENHHDRPIEYTVVVAVERVDAGGESTSVVERRRLTSASATVAPGEEWQEELAVAPELVGEDLRLSYYLYEGEPPDEVGPDSAERHLYLRIDVEDG